MLFSWLKNRRRRKILAEPFAEAWLNILRAQVGHYSVLNDAEQRKLQDAVQIMLAEKGWEGCRGLELTDARRVVIAALAAVLVLGFDDFYFDNVQTILVYPNAFIVKEERAIDGGASLVEEDDSLGIAAHRGPIVLSWAELEENAASPGEGFNLVFHEFAHKLDALNGAMDGTPNLPTDDLAQRWAALMNVEFRKLQRAERTGRETLLDPYGASDPAEFFAVATECFFDAPQAMASTYPQMYALFREYYRQDPAAWRPFFV